MTKLEQLKKDIAEMQSVVNDKDTPQNVKDSINPSLKKAQGMLKELEKLDQKPAAKTTTAAHKPTAKKATAKSKTKKVVAKPIAKVDKQKAKKIVSNIDAILDSVKNNPALKAHYTGTSKSDILKDHQRQAMRPGKRISAEGNVYYENRANRTDIGRRLADGGGVGKIRTQKQISDLWKEKILLVDKLSDKQVAEKWNSEAYGVQQNISSAIEERDVKPSNFRDRLISLLVEKELTEDEYNTYFENGGYIPNNYANKTPQQVWDMWTVKQREHFLADHNNKIEKLIDLDENIEVGTLHSSIYNSFIEKNKSYDNLTSYVKECLTNHLQEGQYEIGGSIVRANRSSLIKYATFEDGSFINLVRLNPNKTNGMPYKGDEKYAISTYKQNEQIVLSFKDLYDAEIKFDELVAERKMHTAIKDQNTTANYKLGGSIPAHFGSGKNIKVFNYQTQHFDSNEQLATAFENAQEHIENEYKEHNAQTFILYSNSLENFAKKVDEILGIEKQIVEKTVENACNKTVELLQEAGVFNYKSGLQISLAEATNLLMPHIATINEFAMLEKKNSTQLLASNTEQSIPFTMNEIDEMLDKSDFYLKKIGNNTEWEIKGEGAKTIGIFDEANEMLLFDENNKDIVHLLEKNGHIIDRNTPPLELDIESQEVKELIASLTEKAKQQILADVVEGTVPKNIKVFFDLDDYVDSNYYGGFTEEDYEPSVNYVVENAVQSNLDEWIKSGGIQKSIMAKGGTIGFSENDYKKLVEDKSNDYPFYSTKNGKIWDILEEKSNRKLAEYYPEKRELKILQGDNERIYDWLKSNSFVKYTNKDYERQSDGKMYFAKGGSTNTRNPKYNIGDFVTYETGDLEIEKWVGVVTKVVDLDTEYAYRVDAYTTNLSSPMQDLSKNNEKYEVQLKPASKLIFNSAKNLVGKPVPKKYQKTAGKKYNRKEAMAAAAKIAGKITAAKKK